MSDPVTNAEVEDVLSSIRRLVSEDKRPIQAPLATPKNDRLVLTPSLRVSDEPEKTAEPEHVADGVDTPVLTNNATRTLDDTSPEVDVEAKISIDSLVIADDFVDASADVLASEADDGLYDVAEVDLDDEDVEDDFLFDDPSADYSTDPYGFDSDSDEDGEHDDSYLKRYKSSELLTDTQTSDKPAAEQDKMRPDTAILSPSSMLDIMKQEKTPAAESDTSNTAATEVDVAPASEKAAVLTAKIAALETAIGQISENWEPDDAGDSDYAGSEGEAMAWEDDLPEAEMLMPVSAHAKRALSEPVEEIVEPLLDDQDQQVELVSSKTVDPAPSATVEAEPSFAAASLAAATSHPETTFEAEDDENAGDVRSDVDLSADEQLIDEEALRDLVSDIVRSELQGALGERITRNVRKLVRREIHRALTAQDLE